MNALRGPRTRLAISAVNLAIFRVIATTQPARVPDVAVDSHLLPVAAVVAKSATRFVLCSVVGHHLISACSAPRSATSLATALNLADTAVDLVATKVDMVVVMAVVVAVAVVVDKPATLAAVTATCPVCVRFFPCPEKPNKS